MPIPHYPDSPASSTERLMNDDRRLPPITTQLADYFPRARPKTPPYSPDSARPSKKRRLSFEADDRLEAGPRAKKPRALTDVSSERPNFSNALNYYTPQYTPVDSYPSAGTSRALEPRSNLRPDHSRPTLPSLHRTSQHPELPPFMHRAPQADHAMPRERRGESLTPSRVVVNAERAEVGRLNCGFVGGEEDSSSSFRMLPPLLRRAQTSSDGWRKEGNRPESLQTETRQRPLMDPWLPSLQKARSMHDSISPGSSVDNKMWSGGLTAGRAVGLLPSSSSVPPRPPLLHTSSDHVQFGRLPGPSSAASPTSLHHTSPSTPSHPSHQHPTPLTAASLGKYQSPYDRLPSVHVPGRSADLTSPTSPQQLGPPIDHRNHYSWEVQGLANDQIHRKRRGNLPKESTAVLNSWFSQHSAYPYPKEEEKQQLQAQTGLTMSQISNWFINARRRRRPSIAGGSSTVVGSTVIGSSGMEATAADLGPAHSPTLESPTSTRRDVDNREGPKQQT